MKKLTHINQKGDAQLVDITDKAITHRKAIAEGTIQLNKDTLKLIQANLIKKGDVLNTAKIAGIQAAKKTWELIPLCHSINLTKIDIEFNIDKKIIQLCVNRPVSVLHKQDLKWRPFQPSASPFSLFMTW
jgi:cyclic pyranopterin monophosphate synthase